MKKLNKIQVNPARLMKNEDLINIKGGYDGPCCVCKAWDGTILGFMWTTPEMCNTDCFNANQTGYGLWNCIV